MIVWRSGAGTSVLAASSLSAFPQEANFNVSKAERGKSKSVQPSYVTITYLVSPLLIFV